MIEGILLDINGVLCQRGHLTNRSLDNNISNGEEERKGEEE